MKHYLHDIAVKMKLRDRENRSLYLHMPIFLEKKFEN